MAFLEKTFLRKQDLIGKIDNIEKKLILIIVFYIQNIITIILIKIIMGKEVLSVNLIFFIIVIIKNRACFSRI